MPADAAAHMRYVGVTVGRDLMHKYRAGQIEHGGRLWQRDDLLLHAYEEALDLTIYLRTELDRRGLAWPRTRA